uniref:RING-type domain-containing protein n=1 Tax=Globisporangium ultimum (strain ATCC 200006 / CBS 805.95 / DAOM BR144) TaxID=431595 RepID=K3WC17_GLOUD
MVTGMRPSCKDPHAAYALGMVIKMLKSHGDDDASIAKRGLASASTPSTVEAPSETSAKLGKLQSVMESARVKSEQKQVLVEMIEDAVTLQDVWAYVDAVAETRDAEGDARREWDNQEAENAESTNGFMSTSDMANSGTITKGDSTLEEQGSVRGADGASESAPVDIPMELGCAICCADLMLKPVSLSCGHSFCKYCLELWLKNCSSCPACRHPTSAPVSMNLALQEVIHTFYPKQIKALEEEDQTERFEQLRVLIRQAVEAGGNDLHEILARLPRNTVNNGGNRSGSDNNRRNRIDQSLAVSMILESDVELQERVLAAEIRERLRKERLLRESSRRRHTAAYNTTSLSAQVNPAILSMNTNHTSSTSTVRRSSNGAGGGASSGSSRNTNLLASFLGRKGS